MVFGKMETEILIREVEKRKIIWDHTSGSYYDRRKKQSAWNEVCHILFDDFASKDDVRKKVIVHDVMGRWRTIRDNYVRKRKMLISGLAAKRYIFDEQLSFLNRVLKRRPSSSGSSIVEQNSEIEDTTESISDQTFPSTLLLQSPKRETPSPIEDKPMNFIEENMMPTSHAYDEDMAFFISLLPTVKKLNTIEKFDFRMKTMELLQNQMKQRHGTAQQIDSPPGYHFDEFSTSNRVPANKMFLPGND